MKAKSVYNKVYNPARDQVSDQIRNQVWNKVWAQVWAQVWNQVHQPLWDQVDWQISILVTNSVSLFIKVLNIGKG